MSSHSSSSPDNSSNPYFLHNDDSLSTLLVSQPLTGNNYSTWSCSMSMAFNAKKKLGFIDGSIPKSSQHTNSLFEPWSRFNNKVLSCILNSISLKFAASIIYIDNAHTI